MAAKKKTVQEQLRTFHEALCRRSGRNVREYSASSDEGRGGSRELRGKNQRKQMGAIQHKDPGGNKNAHAGPEE